MPFKSKKQLAFFAHKAEHSKVWKKRFKHWLGATKSVKSLPEKTEESEDMFTKPYTPKKKLSLKTRVKCKCGFIGNWSEFSQHVLLGKPNLSLIDALNDYNNKHYVYSLDGDLSKRAKDEKVKEFVESEVSSGSFQLLTQPKVFFPSRNPKTGFIRGVKSTKPTRIKRYLRRMRKMKKTAESVEEAHRDYDTQANYANSLSEIASTPKDHRDAALQHYHALSFLDPSTDKEKYDSHLNWIKVHAQKTRLSRENQDKALAKAEESTSDTQFINRDNRRTSNLAWRLSKSLKGAPDKQKLLLASSIHEVASRGYRPDSETYKKHKDESKKFADMASQVKEGVEMFTQAELAAMAPAHAGERPNAKPSKLMKYKCPSCGQDAYHDMRKDKSMREVDPDSEIGQFARDILERDVPCDNCKGEKQRIKNGIKDEGDTKTINIVESVASLFSSPVL